MAGTLDMKNTVLMVIDIQERFVPVIHDVETVVKNSGILVQTANILDIPVVVTEQYPKGLGNTVEDIKTHLSDANSQSFEKNTFSCFANSEIDNALKTLGKKQVIICGIEAHVCVNQTVLAMLNQGYECHLVLDAISSRTPENRQIGIDKMLKAGAWQASTEMVMFELLRDSKHPAFKELLGLIK